MKESRVTIKDIAQLAGVSFSTVSRCLNGSSAVASKTKQKIEKIAKEQGFEFNAGARSLITSKVGSVGIVLPEEFTQVSVNVYHGLLMNSLRTSLEKKDVDLIVTYQKNHFTGQNNILRLVQRNKVDGLILLDENISKDSLEILRRRNVPFVCIHYPPSKETSDQDVIYTDHYAGGRMVADFLLEKGQRVFILLCVNSPHLEFSMREEGFSDRVKLKGGQIIKLESELTFESARACLKKNSPILKEADGLFAMNDLMALGAMRAAQELGYQIPRDLSVVGYDNSEFSEISYPSLTTVHQPREDLALLSCDRLFHQMECYEEKQVPRKRLIGIQPQLKIRNSA